jgi:Leucine-rich repeat (LRR) protein
MNSATVLNISKNRIEKLPNDFRVLSDYLVNFNYSFNGLTSIPVEVFTLKNLQTLDLRGNQLSNISVDISRLESLRELVIGDNRYCIVWF